MALSFPNECRSYDATRRAVRFWGYDSAMENSFFVTEDALKRFNRICGSTKLVFCAPLISNRSSIYAAALKVYSRGRKGSYDLVTADFRR